MPWRTCAAAKQKIQFGIRMKRQTARRRDDAMAQVGFGRAHQICVFTAMSTKAFLPSRIPAPLSAVVRTCSRQHLGRHHRNFTHTLHSRALHGRGWYSKFCISFAAPQLSVCDGLSSSTSCCLDAKQGSWEVSAVCQSGEHDHHDDFHVSLSCIRVNQLFASCTSHGRLSLVCHPILTLNPKSKTFQHFISSHPCVFFSLIEHWGTFCAILHS